MFEVSESAEAYIDAARTASGLPETVGIRMSRSADPGEGAIRISFTNDAGSDDARIEHSRIPIFVDPDLVPVLDGRVLDTRQTDGAEHLVMRANRADDATSST
jgi:Fe-S cluster assembly iron-binding protein IscA